MSFDFVLGNWNTKLVRYGVLWSSSTGSINSRSTRKIKISVKCWGLGWGFHLGGDSDKCNWDAREFCDEIVVNSRLSLQ